jgi:hypothetical protein
MTNRLMAAEAAPTACPDPAARSPWTGGPRDGKAPCQGCRHLFVRYGSDSSNSPRPVCGQGVEYGQPGCVRAPRPEYRHG